MKKTPLTERFQQLAGLKPLYELSMDNFNEGEEQDLKDKLISVQDKIANHPLMQKAIDKVAKSPRLFKLIQKAASKFGLVNLNENLEGDIDFDAIVKTAMKHKGKLNEDNDGSLALSAIFGIPFLTTLLPEPLFNAVSNMIPGSGSTEAFLLTVATTLVSILVIGVARKIKGGPLTKE